jgi:hypothetical protein
MSFRNTVCICNEFHTASTENINKAAKKGHLATHGKTCPVLSDALFVFQSEPMKVFWGEKREEVRLSNVKDPLQFDV